MAIRELISLNFLGCRVPTVNLHFRPNTESNLVYLMIPGNPGVVDYYEEFLQTIFDENEKAIHVVAVEHAGHSPGDHNQGENYDLEHQIAHKIAMMDYFCSVNPQTQFIIGGHSVGAYICLQILHRRPDLKVLQSHMLLPTLKLIGSSPNGKKLTPVFNNFSRRTISALSVPLSQLPLEVKIKLVQLVTKQKAQYAKITAQNLIHPKVVRNSLYMAGTEMREIQELDHNIIKQHEDKLHFFYGRKDGWVPLDHYHEIKDNYSNAQVTLCDEDIPHAYVLGYGNRVGKLASEPVKKLRTEHNLTQTTCSKEMQFLKEANVKIYELSTISPQQSTQETSTSHATLGAILTGGIPLLVLALRYLS